MERLCVFCGSNAGSRAVYADAAKRLGEALAARGWGLIYGGGHVGLMGILADSVLACGGSVIGVIPQALVDKELAHPRLSQLHVVSTMHQRKALPGAGAHRPNQMRTKPITTDATAHRTNIASEIRPDGRGRSKSFTRMITPVRLRKVTLW